MLVAVSLEAAAHADPASDTAALKRFDEGRKAFEAGTYTEALKAFQDSLALVSSPNTRLYMARCYRKLDKPASAFSAYRLAAREAADRLTASGEKRYAATRDAATAESAEIEASVPRLTIAVPGDAPDGTSVKVDDVELPKAAWGVAVETDPGEHAITATAPRRDPFTTKVTLKPGDQQRVDVKIARLPTGTIALVLNSRPGGMEIVLDDKPLDASDWLRAREVDAGEHHLVVRAPGYVDFNWKANLADGERAQVAVTLEQDKTARAGGGGTPKWMFFSVAGLAVASLGVGTVIAVSAKSKADAEKKKDPLLRSHSAQDSVRSLSTDANILFVAGAALAVGGGVLFFTTNWQGEAAPKTGFVSPWVGPTAGGLVAGGTF